MSKYKQWRQPDQLVLLTGWARDGLSMKEIAHNVGINETTLAKWKKRYPEIAEALRDGKDVADYMVENALYQRAIGYQVTETTVMTDSAGNVTTTKTTRYIKPKPDAQIFWLKHRSPEKWDEKWEERERAKEQARKRAEEEEFDPSTVQRFIRWVLDPDAHCPFDEYDDPHPEINYVEFPALSSRR